MHALEEDKIGYDVAFGIFGVMMAASGAMLFFIPCLRNLANAFANKRQKSVGTVAAQYSKGTGNGASSQLNGGGSVPAERVKLIEPAKGQSTGLVLPTVLINDRRASATPGAVMAWNQFNLRY